MRVLFETSAKATQADFTDAKAEETATQTDVKTEVDAATQADFTDAKAEETATQTDAKTEVDAATQTEEADFFPEQMQHDVVHDEPPSKKTPSQQWLWVPARNWAGFARPTEWGPSLQPTGRPEMPTRPPPKNRDIVRALDVPQMAVGGIFYQNGQLLEAVGIGGGMVLVQPVS